MEHRIILVEWLDSKGVTNEWEYLDDIEPLELCSCTTVGFLIDDNELYKTIAQNISTTQVLGRISIPCCSIQNMRDISG